MKRNYILFLFLLCFFYSCKSKDNQPAGKSENDIDAARNFIRSALDGKYDEARTFMLSDSLNNNYMDLAERASNNQTQNVKDSLRTSTIKIHNVDPVNDSTTILIFSNSFKNEPYNLKVLKIKNQWLVDLKYLYQHDADTISTKPLLKDSIK